MAAQRDVKESRRQAYRTLRLKEVHLDDGKLDLNFVARRWILAESKRTSYGDLDLRRMAECHVELFGRNRRLLERMVKWFDNILSPAQMVCS